MGRPTSDRKGKVVIVRISEELHERLVKESERENVSMSEYARGILSGEIKCNTESEEIESLKSENSVLQNEIERLLSEKKESKTGNVIQNPLELSPEKYRDIRRMCEVSGISIGKFMESVYRLFNEGRIYIDGLVVKARGEYELSALEDACHRLNADPQEMIDKLVKSLTRG